MTELNGAVFLSYPSEDTAAAQPICAALRRASIEVWFDQSELRDGDAHRVAEQSVRRATAILKRMNLSTSP